MQQPQQPAQAQKLPKVVGVDLKNLTPMQRQHLEIYRQINVLKINGQYSKLQCFEPRFKPFLDFMNAVKPLVEAEIAKTQNMMLEATNNNRADIVNVCNVRINVCNAIVKTCQDVAAGYKSKNVNKLDNLMESYVYYESVLKTSGVQPPRREWLSQYEAQTAIDKLGTSKGNKK